MPEIAATVLPSPENAAYARRGRRPLKSLPDRSSHGWASSDRAPRLRRVASMLEALVKAKKCDRPERALRLARDMRLRAAKIELGMHCDAELDEAIALITTFGDGSGCAGFARARTNRSSAIEQRSL